MNILITLSILFMGFSKVMADEFKEVNYLNGAVKFKIPSHWKEVYNADPNAGAEFFVNGSETGTFRIYLLSMQPPENVKVMPSIEEFISMQEVKSSKIEVLENKNALRTWVERSIDRGSEITIYYWQLANFVKPNNYRIANYSFTILTSKEQDKYTIDQVKMLVDQVKNSIFSEK